MKYLRLFRFSVLSLLTFLLLNQPAGAETFSAIGNSQFYKLYKPGITIDSKKINKIVYPLLSTPAIVKTGTEFTLKLDTGGQYPDSLTVFLKNRSDSVIKGEYKLDIGSVTSGNLYWRKDANIYEVKVKVPENITENLYDLFISYKKGPATITDSQPHSVKIVNEFKKNFTFIHMTDLHIGSIRNLTDPKEAGYWVPDENKRWLYLQKAISEVNSLNPDFVLISGDLMFGQFNPLEYVYEYEEIYRVLQLFNVPVFIVPGNHDHYAQDGAKTDGAEFWYNYFGPDYYSFNYGEHAHIIAANTFDWDINDRIGYGLSVVTWGGQIRSKQLEWIATDLSANSCAAGPEQSRILLTHYNPLKHDNDIWPADDPLVKKYWREYDKKHNPQKKSTLLLGEVLGLKYDQNWHGEGADELIDFIEEYDIKLGLFGHTHIDEIMTSNNINYVTTSSIELGGDPWIGYRIFNKNSSGEYDFRYNSTDYSIPVYKDGNSKSSIKSFTIEHSGKNNGTEQSGSATIINYLERDITLYIPFYAANKVQDEYTLSDGEIIVEQESNGIKYILARIEVGAGKTVTLSLK